MKRKKITKKKKMIDQIIKVGKQRGDKIKRK